MTVSELYVYPVKGAAGIALQRAQLDSFGIEHDRRWMIVDAAGAFLTQREHPVLALLRASLEPDALLLESEAGGSVRLPLRPQGDERTRVRVWHDEVDAVDAGAEGADVVSRHLGFEARLVFMPEDVLRQADTTYARSGDRVSFADAFPLLLIGQASLDQLSMRVGEPLTMRRFRPNIVVAGAVPHAEDAWRRIRIGAVECDVVKPCARCAVTTVDPATGMTGREPLRTLATYRRVANKVFFGQNLIHRSTGTLRVGDEVTVLNVGTPRPDLSPQPQ